MSDIVLSVDRLGKMYKVGRQPFWALKDVSLEVKRGEVLGVVGRNGAGKTTLLRLLARITDPTEGQAIVRGRIGTLLETGTGFHEDLSGRENVYLNGSILGMRPHEIRKRFEEIVEFSGVGRFIDSAVKSYSSGMRSRLAFSVAAHLETDILLVDEVLAVGDIAFQEKCLNKMGQLTREDARTILFVSHSMGAVQSLCTRGILIENGQLAHDGSTGETVSAYQELLLGKQGEASLAATAGRPGSGAVRLTAMHIQDLDGNPVREVPAGTGCRIVFDYESTLTAPSTDVVVTIVLVGSKGLRLFGLPSDIVRSELTVDKPKGQFVCTIPRLPLLPGNYDIVGSVLVDRELTDKITNMAHVIVSDRDVYGTGRLQQGNFGDVFVDFSWSNDVPGGRVG